jgi:UDP-N-acetylmuramyl pentapeptide synthase
MKDLGSLSKEAHTKLGEQIARSKINYLLTIGKIASLIAQAAKKAKFKGKIVNVGNTSEALKELKELTNHKTLVLIKGSRHAHLERIVYGLLHKSTKVNCYHCGVLK